MKNKKEQIYSTKEYIVLAISITFFILLRILFFEGIIMSALMPVIGYFIALAIIKFLRKKEK